MEFHVFQLVPISSCPDTGNHREKFGFVLFTPSRQIFVCIHKILPEPSLLKAEQSQFIHSFLIQLLFQVYIIMSEAKKYNMKREHV